jgi:hypothetical protein
VVPDPRSIQDDLAAVESALFDLFTYPPKSDGARVESRDMHQHGLAALRRVEAELTRLRRENEEMRMVLDSQGWERVHEGQWERQEASTSNVASEPYTWEVINTRTTNSESVFPSRELAERRLAELPEGFAVVAFDSKGNALGV